MVSGQKTAHLPRPQEALRNPGNSLPEGTDLASDDSAQIYLATPPAFSLSEFPQQLAAVLDAFEIACVRVSLASHNPDDLARACDILREVAHARDVAIVVDDHYRMVKTHGLDGVHLTDGARHVRDARKELGPDAIVGAFCGTSRHAGMSAAEIGTDYISFGPVSDTGALGDGGVAEPELFQWWSEMIEVPVVAEGVVTEAVLPALKDHIDFLTLGSEIWTHGEDAAAFLNRFIALLR